MAEAVRMELSKRSDAILFKGNKETYDRALLLMEEYGLPRELLMPLRDVEEGGGIEATGDVWLKQKSTVKHHFKKAKAYVSYAPEISCQLEKNKMKNIKGVKTRKKLVPIHVPLFEIVVDDQADPPTILFKTYGGVHETFPLSAFKEEDKEDDNKDKNDGPKPSN